MYQIVSALVDRYAESSPVQEITVEQLEKERSGKINNSFILVIQGIGKPLKYQLDYVFVITHFQNIPWFMQNIKYHI